MGHISPVVLRQEVGRRIRVARQNAELTIVEAAERLELTRSALSRLENGIGRVTVRSRWTRWFTNSRCASQSARRR